MKDTYRYQTALFDAESPEQSSFWLWAAILVIFSNRLVFSIQHTHSLILHYQAILSLNSITVYLDFTKQLKWVDTRWNTLTPSLPNLLCSRIDTTSKTTGCSSTTLLDLLLLSPSSCGSADKVFYIIFYIVLVYPDVLLIFSQLAWKHQEIRRANGQGSSDGSWALDCLITSC